MSRFHTAAVLSAFFLASVASADHRSPTYTVGMIEENDSFAIGGDDSEYTQGLKFYFFKQDDKGWVKKLEPSWFRPDDPDATYHWGIVFGQEIYTPGDITISAPIDGDRPYAGWIYTGVAVQRRQKTTFDSLELDLGVLGPDSLAEESQKFVHRVISAPRPEGWAHQLGTQWSANLAFQRRWRTGKVMVFDKIPFDIIPHSGAMVGNILTAVNMGNTIRMGIVRLPEDFGTDFIFNPGATGAWGGDVGAYLFARVEGRFVIYNAFLDRVPAGGIPNVDKELVVADVAAGIAVKILGLRLSYTQSIRTPEFKRQGRPHTYASFNASYSF